MSIAVRPATQPTLTEIQADLIVDRIEQAADGVISIEFVRSSGSALPMWSPGAHIDVMLDEDTVRQYSLCGDPTDPGRWRIGVLNDPNGRGGSRRIHQELAAGASVTVRGPRNHFPMEESPRYLFIAGGIGITPILPMIRQAESIGAQWELVYGGRTLDSMAFLGELAEYGDRVRLLPQEEHGHLPLDEVLGEVRADTLVYSCGPEPLLAAVEAASAHWPAGSLHLERFSAKSLADDPTAGAFDIVLAKSGKTLTVPANRSILEVLEGEGHKILSSCRAGVCGTCEVDVIDGTPDHRDTVLSAEEREENEYMLVCVSRACSSKLVLDL